MAEDIGKWIRGEENSGTMDILYGDLQGGNMIEKPTNTMTIKVKMTEMDEVKDIIASFILCQRILEQIET